MKNILVATSKAKNAERLLEKASEFARAFDSKIWILHVTEPDPDSFIGLESGPQFAQDKRVEERKRKKLVMKELENSLKAKNIDAEGLVLEGPTVKTIKQEVRELNVDLVLIGHQNKNFFYQIFVGNLEEDIIDDLKIPVILVPLP